MNYPINAAGVSLLKQYEKFARTSPGNPNMAHAYWDELGKVWTIGWGFTSGVQQGDTMTRAAADLRLSDDLHEYVDAVRAACKVEPNQNHLAALTVCAWNIGVGGLRKSSMIRAHNRGDFQAAARAFGLWNKAGGKAVAGLTRRRAAEAALYLQPVDNEPLHDMPQAVDEEKPMTRSTIATAGTATAAVSTISVVAQVSQEVRTIKDSLSDILPFVVLAMAVVGIGFGGWTVWERLKQRRGGWA